MRTSWQRGVLLGVSLALLLAGGVALAQAQLTASVDKDCLPCWPGPWGPEAEQDPTAGYIAVVTIGNADPEASLCFQIQGFGDWLCSPEPIAESSPWLSFAAGCDEMLCFWPGELSGEPGECWPFVLGQWTFGFWQEEANFHGLGDPPDVMPASVTFELAEVCEPEFVPEPGTIALLGSGLAGLAGYAALRWRSRQ